MILFTGTGAIANAFKEYYSCKIVSARFLNDAELEELIRSSSTIIHNSAAVSSDSLSSYMDSNFILTKRIVDIAYKINPNIKFINISSMSILKNSEEYLNTFEMGDYALSKYFAEIYCLQHPLKELVNVRFSTIFYKDPKRDGLSKLAFEAIKNKEITIFNNGESCRDFIPIDIAVKYLYKIVEKKLTSRKVNIVSGESLSFKYFVDKLIQKDPNIKVNNINAQIKNILNIFDKKDINYLKEIDFSMDFEFEKYIDSLCVI